MGDHDLIGEPPNLRCIGLDDYRYGLERALTTALDGLDADEGGRWHTRRALERIAGEFGISLESPPGEEMTEDDPGCTHCNGEGLCWDGSDPLGNCPDGPHRCHACGGSGARKDQTIW